MTGDRIAADAWPLIRAFRESGGRGFERLGVAEARRVYESSCALNAVPKAEMAEVSELSIGPDGALGARLYVPPGAPAHPPVVLFLHGGGWVIGSLRTHDRLCRQVAARSGAAVLAVDYRLAPEAPFPAAITDARDALAWLASEPEGLGFSPQGIAVMGDSAGGGMAAAVAREYSPGRVGPPLVAQVLLYPVVDLAMDTESYRRVTEGLPLTAATMAWFAELYVPSPVDRLDPAVSPLRGEQPEAPAAAFVCTVGQDPLADEGIAYAAALARAGGRVEHVHLPQHAHGLFTSAGRIPTGRLMLDRVGSFLADAFGGGTAGE